MQSFVKKNVTYVLSPNLCIVGILEAAGIREDLSEKMMDVTRRSTVGSCTVPTGDLPGQIFLAQIIPIEWNM